MEFEPYEPTEEDAIGAFMEACEWEYDSPPNAINQPNQADVEDLGNGVWRVALRSETDERGEDKPQWATVTHITGHFWDVTFPSGKTRRVAGGDGEEFVTQSEI